MKRIAVIGSRTFDNFKLLSETLQKLPTPAKIISGGATGADSLAERYAMANKIPVEIFKPDYHRYGKAAPLKRNDIIVAACDMVIAFWDGQSRGTLYTINKAKKMNKEVLIIRYQNNPPVVPA